MARSMLQDRTGQGEGQDAFQSAIPRWARNGLAPLSFAQERLWFLDQWKPGTSVYNVPLAWQLSGELKAMALEQSLNEVVQRHEVLRTTLPSVDGQPYQAIAPHLRISLPVVDLRGVPDSERWEKARRLMEDESRQPFDLSQGPLLRASLIRLGEQLHVLMLVVHHIAFDGWSVGLLLHELSESYTALSRNRAHSLLKLPIQYADFAVWQREKLQGDVLEEQLSYWREQLADAPPSLELPMDRARPAEKRYLGARQSLPLSQNLAGSLKAISREARVTLFMTLLAAFQVLLHRYTGQDDIVVGSPIANRNCLEIERLIGFFVNTLVLRCDLSGDPTFRELLGRVRETCLDAYDHQDLPFEKLVAELQPVREPSQTPLFQVMFQLLNYHRDVWQLGDVQVEALDVDRGSVPFDLTLSVVEKPEGLTARLAYDTDLFERTTIVRMLGHYQMLLGSIADNPDQRIGLLPMLTESERRQLLVQWNDTDRPCPRHQGVHELIEERVERNPDALAVICEDEQLTYAELNARANQLAHHLIQRGVGPEVRVALCAEHSVGLAVAVLGILKAGAAWVPVDPDDPAERQAFKLRDSRAALLLTQARLVAKHEGFAGQQVLLDTDWIRIAQHDTMAPHVPTGAQHMAYVMYTSGSTGVPKGVMIGHAAVCNFVQWVQRVFRLGEADRVMFSSRIGFDGFVTELLAALGAGARVVVRPPDVHPGSAQFVELLAQHGVTVLNVVPSLLRILLSEGRLGELSQLRLVLCGGEVLPAELKERCLSQTQAALYNLYGPSETTVDVTFWRCKDVTRRKPVPIGRAIDNVQAYVLDTNLQLVPLGIAGELCVGGIALARGYLGRPGMTADKFVPDPFSRDGGARLYRTGDLAQCRPDGNLEFLGRVDDQVKIRGFRVELGEVETVLADHPAIRGAAVVVREDSPGDQRLVAYVVAAEGQGVEIGELRSYLRGKLPAYMMPGAFVVLEALPRTPSGKLDRRSLPAPSRERIQTSEGFVAPRTAVEEAVAQVWAEVLGLERVSAHDNFFELGGHSLLATQVVARLRKMFGIELRLRDLFERPTIVGLAEVTELARRSDAEVGCEIIKPSPRQPFRATRSPEGAITLPDDVSKRE